ncbi:MAG TPA: DUF882 domain-containing protein [Polyangiaceae bacterium]|nr:DUF882 domain-containing protein [Polyangiaceae bacterium]
MAVPIRIQSVLTLALALAPAIASATPRTEGKLHKAGVRAHHHREARAVKEAKLRECVKAPVEVVAGAESAKLSLAKCDGAAAPAGVDQLSTLARAPGAHRLDARLVERLELVVDHFRKGTESARVVIVSGYRPRSAGSYHSTGRALDFRIDGVANEALVALCKTLPDTGCGFYPNSGFVHMDIRDPGTGHVAWTDVSRPGETPRYVSEDSPAPSTLPSLPSHGADAKSEDEKPAGKDEVTHAL